MPFQILNSTQQSIVAAHAAKADTVTSRMRGLLGRQQLNSDEALVITQCQSIHMFFMRYPIDVIFADRHDKVVGVVLGIQPFCLSPVFWNASYAIELKVGAIEKSGTTVGDQLEIREKQ